MTIADTDSSSSEDALRKPRKVTSRLTMLLRRVHLYAGLFLLPWVFLYGVTGAMYNHQGLFPDTTIAAVDASQLADSALKEFPSGVELANRVVAALRDAAPDATIRLDESHGPEFANDVILQLNDSGVKYAVHIDPIEKSAWVATHPVNKEELEPLLTDVRNIKLYPNPFELAQKSVPTILRKAGIDTDASPKPMGWSKLNFLATVDGQPARVTYVLRDGHVDITKYEGQDGMSPRSFFMRLHTTHGQTPHWNGRMIWSVFVDVMAIAMVSWGLTGLVMWWKIKRTRLIGGAVIALSLTTAGIMYFSMLHFYATTKL